MRQLYSSVLAKYSEDDTLLACPMLSYSMTQLHIMHVMKLELFFLSCRLFSSSSSSAP